MSTKGLNYPVIRKIITIILLLLITGSFLAIYYLVYLPQEHESYNLRTFRILHEVAVNLNDRVNTYGLVSSNKYITNTNQDTVLRLPDTTMTISVFKRIFDSSFRGDASQNTSIYSTEIIKHDTVIYNIFNKTTNKLIYDTAVPLRTIFEPIITNHSDVFGSILLIKQTADSDNADKRNRIHYDPILYQSEKLNIANFNTDSLFNRNIEAPVISDLNIENIDYKMYLLPFKLDSDPNETFVLTGIISNDSYRDQSQNPPVDLLLSVCLLLIVLLLALPFLKIFFLSAEETININDVRAVITVIFIIPFFATLIAGGIWLWLYSNTFCTKVLSSLQDSVQNNFYKEISESIQQAKSYDTIVAKPAEYINTGISEEAKKFYRNYENSIDFKDIFFYPKYYKNLKAALWIDSSGNDIAAWNFIKPAPTYINVSDRQYFKNLKYNKLYFLPSSTNYVKDSFSLEPVLSRSTGEYSINLLINSNSTFGFNKKARAIDISAKMYSIFNTVVPNGYSFCIMDEKGNILCHSDTARNLQENIFQECSDSFALRYIISHKDSVLIPDIGLYDQSVRMIIKPLQGMPYYIITYYNKRSEYLFLFHILAFVFVSEATLLLFVSLFSYFMMISDKKNSKLFFTPSTLTWLKPSPDKKNYYIKNSIQVLSFTFFIWLISRFFNDDKYYLYTLNAGLLLPLFAVMGYYIIKSSRGFIEKESINKFFFTKRQFWKFLGFIKNILLLYMVSAAFFLILQNVLFFNKTCESQTDIKAGIGILLILVPVIIILIAGINFDYKNKQLEKHKSDDTSYLTQFIISLLLSVTLISVIPTIIFLSYAFREEKTLQIQSLQIDLAKKIQQRRSSINPKLWQTKLNLIRLGDTLFKDSAIKFIDELKFNKDKGIYLLNNDTLIKLGTFPEPIPSKKDTNYSFFRKLLTRDTFPESVKRVNCSPFYKLITQYLFLPPDHDEFYDDSSHDAYYYWSSYYIKDKQDSLCLYYKNTTDNKSSSSLLLSSVSPHPRLFRGLTGNYIGLLILLGLVILGLLFYKTIYAVSIRVFLIGFFEEINGKAGNKPDGTLLIQSSISPNLIEDIKNILGTEEEINFAVIRKKENEKISDEDDGDAYIIELHLALLHVYENIWDNCTDAQKYTLYNFAIDGFTNYKKVLILYELYKAGLLVKEDDDNITLVTKSFRNFLITKEAAPEIGKFDRQGKKGSWSSLRTIFYVILIAVAVFIFISQEEASKRLITIVTSLGALLPAMLKLFDKSTSAAPATKSGD